MNQIKILKYSLAFCLFSGAMPAFADLSRVSPGISATGDPAAVTVFPPAPWDPASQTVTVPGDYRGANFPLWYEDRNGMRLTLCVDGAEGGFPCAKEGSPVFTDAECTQHFYPYQDVVGFGDEGFYFKTQSSPFDVPLTGAATGGFAQMQLLLETTWGGDERFDPLTGTVGAQQIFIEDELGACVSAAGGDLHRVEPGHEMLFARSRLRVLPGSPAGWYRMTYPYGVKTIFHPQPGEDVGIRTEIRQLVGDLRIFPIEGRPAMQDFTIALNDPQTLIDRFTRPVALSIPYIGLRATGFINDPAAGLKSIGPFLYKPDFRTDPKLRVEENGFIFQYIGNFPDEANPAASPGHQVLGSNVPDDNSGYPPHESGFQNYFRIEYQAGVSGTPPDAGAWAQVGYTDLFNVVGKLADVERVPSTFRPAVIILAPLLLD